LVKLSNGEYIAVERIESKLAESPYVRPNGLMVYADSEREYPVALVLPQESYLKSKHNGDIAELVDDEEVNKAVLKSLQDEARKANLGKAETVQKIKLINDEWTVENGMLSSAEKLKHNAIAKKYKDEIEELYGEKSDKKSSKKTEKKKQPEESQTAPAE
jgi:long-chain acyl-CoA synthetase